VTGTTWYRVNINIEYLIRGVWDGLCASLFERLPHRCLQHSLIGFAVPPRLKPLSQFAVMDKKCHRHVRIDYER